MVGYEPDLNLPKLADCDDEEFFSLLLPSAGDCFPSSVITPSLRPDTGFEDNDNYEEEDVGFNGHLATPLVQVFSVSVSTDFDDGKPCEIHGSICVFEGPDCLYHLYHRFPEDSETILEEPGSLSLIGPHDGAILPSMRTKLVIQLTDRIHGVDVVDGELSFDLTNEDLYDRLLKGTVKGDHGSAFVYYVVFRFAFYGYVQVTVTQIDNTADIYGRVVARYENARMYCSDEKDVKQLETRLFYHPSCKPLRLLVGTDIRMSTNVVVVPIYSTLAIEVNLWDLNGKIASGRLQFPAYLQSEVPLYIQTQYASVEVQIIWQNVYLDPNMDQRRKELHNQHLLANLASPPPLPGTKQYSGLLKAEVFTVFIGGINEKVSALCGTILVEDGSDIFSIYNRDESCCELLQDHSLACIEVNYRAIQDCEFYIILNLTDPDGKLEVSRGCITFRLGYLDWDMHNRRMCSVVPGKDGYAAVHYEVFDNAFEAFLEVKLFAANGDLDIPTSLYGTMVACYSGHNYSTS